VVVIASGEVWGGLSGVRVVAGVVLAAVVVVAVLSNARPRRINISRRRVEPAVPRSCARGRWWPVLVVPVQGWVLSDFRARLDQAPIGSSVNHLAVCTTEHK